MRNDRAKAVGTEDYEEVVRAEFIRLCEEWDLCNVVLRRTNRFRTRLGQFSGYISGAGLVEYTHKLAFESEDFIKDVVRHEIAHAIEFSQFGNVSHSAQWREIAKEVGCYPGANAYPEERHAAVAASRGKV